MRILVIRTLIFLNFVILLGHLFLERSWGDLNWLRLGDRSPSSKAYIGFEGVMAMTLVLAIFDHFYPNMKDMVRSKLTLVTICILSVEVAVWLLYR